MLAFIGYMILAFIAYLIAVQVVKFAWEFTKQFAVVLYKIAVFPVRVGMLIFGVRNDE